MAVRVSKVVTFMPASVAAVLERFDAEPGVQYAVNDPYAGGTHLNDLTIVSPVFVEGQLVAWVGNRAHHADVGGSLVLLDPRRIALDPDTGQDRFESIEVLTPEVCFPESSGWPARF